MYDYGAIDYRPLCDMFFKYDTIQAIVRNFEFGDCMNPFLILILSLSIGCGDSTYDCETDSDCADGEECVITHDHEGDDHDHGGLCEAVDTAD